MDQVVEYDVTDSALEQLREEFAEVPDVTTKKGYEIVRLGLAKIRTLRVSVEKRRKELKAEALAHGRKVDGEAGRITGVLEAIEGPMKDAKTAFDVQKEEERQENLRVEQARKEAITARITNLRSVPMGYADSSADAIGEAREVVVALNITDGSFEEFAEEVAIVKDEVLKQLHILHTKAVAREEEEARLKKEREEFEAGKLKDDWKRQVRECLDATKNKVSDYALGVSFEIAGGIELLEGLELDKDFFGEFLEEAEEVKADTLQRLGQLHEQALSKEKLEREAEDRRKADKKKEEDETARIAKEAEDLLLEEEEKEAEKERKKKEKEDKKLQEAKRADTIAAIDKSITADMEEIEFLVDRMIAGEIPNVTYE